MILWHLHFTPGNGGYDSFSDFVVCAPTEERARAAITRCGEECRVTAERDSIGRNHSSADDRSQMHYRFDDTDPVMPCVWTDPAMTSCIRIGTADEGVAEGIIVESFHAG